MWGGGCLVHSKHAAVSVCFCFGEWWRGVNTLHVRVVGRFVPANLRSAASLPVHRQKHMLACGVACLIGV
jgi:hypothetical protein